jgi:peroxiredoxin Q/BCP
MHTSHLLVLAAGSAASCAAFAPAARPALRPAAARAATCAVAPTMIAEGEAFPADAAARLGVKGKNAVVYFYGADGSPSCTKEAEAFDAANAEFKKLGFDVVGVRPENQAKSAFAEKYSQRFVPDTDNEIRKQLDIKGDLFGLLAGRETYVIDKAGQVQMVFNSQFKPEQHVENALEAAAVVAQNGRQGSFLDNLKLPKMPSFAGKP